MQSKRDLYRAESITSGERWSQHKPKQLLFGVIQESKRQIANLDFGYRQMYSGQTDFFLNQYEEALKRPFGYLLTNLKTANQDNCGQRTNVLPSEEGFNQAGF